MKLVSDILNSKGHEIWAVKPDDTVFDSLQLMAEKEIGALLVMDEDRLVGIVTERDYARKSYSKENPPKVPRLRKS